MSVSALCPCLPGWLAGVSGVCVFSFPLPPVYSAVDFFLRLVSRDQTKNYHDEVPPPTYHLPTSIDATAASWSVVS